ncbi:hypothetical protein PMAYCL1PPCAC_27205, partial [Pristionchus mayeri]
LKLTPWLKKNRKHFYEAGVALIITSLCFQTWTHATHFDQYGFEARHFISWICTLLLLVTWIRFYVIKYLYRPLTKTTTSLHTPYYRTLLIV